MNNLTQRQTALLTHALSNGGALFPLPESLCPIGIAKRSIMPLLRRKLLVEIIVTDEATAWRTSEDQHFGLMLTSLGRSLVMPTIAESDITDAAPPPPKIARVKALLEREGGVAMDEIVSLTGWLPHTARAALTGLRKRGHVILRSASAGGSFYRIIA